MNSPSITRETLLRLIATSIHATTTHALAQVARDANDPERAIRQWALREEKKGMLVCARAMAQPEVTLSHPLLDWEPSVSQPDFDHIAYQAAKRWEAPPVRRLVVMASPKAKKLFGASLVNRPLRARELNHDIGMAQVFWHLLASDPTLPEKWVFEDQLIAEGRHCLGEAIPDAVIRGSPPLLIEFAGRYSAKKLRAIHRDYSGNHYQLW